MPLVPWKYAGDKQWFSKIPGGSKITYDGVGTVQLTFLKMSYSEAVQNFTYYCRNSVAWHDRAGNNYEKSLTFLGDNEMERDRLLDIPCKVCGDRSSGKHYGIYSCD
uniref:Uncharacterized protein n=1 Tax=Musca domestica TaxID=7370 RepID=A0A1I8NIX0_MUSDO